MEQHRLNFERMLRLFLTVVTLIVVVFMAQILLQMQEELNELKTEFTILTQEPVSAIDFEPFAPLEENCIQCHSERRFMGKHKCEEHIPSIYEHLAMNPDFALSPEEINRIHAAMDLLKCTQCHGEAMVKEFAALSTAAQRKILKRMENMPGSVIATTDQRAIQRSLQVIQGF